MKKAVLSRSFFRSVYIQQALRPTGIIQQRSWKEHLVVVAAVAMLFSIICAQLQAAPAFGGFAALLRQAATYAPSRGLTRRFAVL